MILRVPLDKAKDPKLTNVHNSFRSEWCISLAFPALAKKNAVLFLPSMTEIRQKIGDISNKKTKTKNKTKQIAEMSCT